MRGGGERALPPTLQPSGEAISAPVGPGHLVPVDAHNTLPGSRQERPVSMDAPAAWQAWPTFQGLASWLVAGRQGVLGQVGSAVLFWL